MRNVFSTTIKCDSTELFAWWDRSAVNTRRFKKSAQKLLNITITFWFSNVVVIRQGSSHFKLIFISNKVGINSCIVWYLIWTCWQASFNTFICWLVPTTVIIAIVKVIRIPFFKVWRPFTSLGKLFKMIHQLIKVISEPDVAIVTINISFKNRENKCKTNNCGQNQCNSSQKTKPKSESVCCFF